jgi:hypothetical protein
MGINYIHYVDYIRQMENEGTIFFMAEDYEGSTPEEFLQLVQETAAEEGVILFGLEDFEHGEYFATLIAEYA